MKRHSEKKLQKFISKNLAVINHARLAVFSASFFWHNCAPQIMGSPDYHQGGK